MEQDNRELLEGRIKTEIENLAKLTPGSDEHSKAVEALTKLYKLSIEQTENERTFMQRSDQDLEKEREWQLRNAQLREQSIERYFKYGTEIGLGVASLVFYGIWMKRGFKFEETGTFTSTVFRNLFGKFRPTR